MTYRDLRRRYLAGASLSTLATVEGVSPNSIARKLRLMGVTVRDRGGSQRKLAACLPQVFNLYYDSGLTAAQVGAALGVSESTVLRTLQWGGLGIRRPGPPVSAKRRRDTDRDTQ